MKKSLNLFILLFFSFSVFAENRSPIGTWRSIDDSTGEAKSIIQITSNQGKLEGKIVSLLNHDDPNPLCEKCKGKRANQAVIGMTILWDIVKLSEGVWGDGKVLDPENGKTYRLTLSLADEGDRLKVRGYIGTPILGRTQFWERHAPQTKEAFLKAN